MAAYSGRNIAISSYHRRRRARPREVPLDKNTLPLDNDGPERMINAWLVATALNSINPDHRAVIVELFYMRRPVAQVAALLGIPEGTVRSRCSTVCGLCATNIASLLVVTANRDLVTINAGHRPAHTGAAAQPGRTR